MGIKNLFKTFTYKGENKTIKKDEIVGVDALSLLMICLNGGIELTCGDKYTTHIQTLAYKFIKMNYKQIWVFDNIDKRADKAKTIENRQKYKNNNVFDKIKMKDAINDLKKILDLLSIPYVISPPKIEGETYLVEMKKMGLINYILSKDTDILAYGEDLLFPLPANKYLLYRVDKILEELEMTMDVFRKMCCLLGTDFTEKGMGITPNNITSKVYNVNMTNSQNTQYIIFSIRASLVYKDNNEIFEKIKSPVFTEDLVDYLEKYECVKAANAIKKLI